jgi:hypothetical protein
MIGLDAESTIMICAVIWGIMLLLTFAQYGGKPFGTVGLPLAFILCYTSAYAGALVHLVDGYDHFMNPYLRAMNFTRDTVAAGVEASSLAILAAFFGFRLVDFKWPVRRRLAACISLELLRKGSLSLMTLGFGFLMLGAASVRMNITLPGLQAVQSTLENLLVVGGCGFILHSYMTQGWFKALAWAGILALITPAVRLVTVAILADSVVIGIVIASFLLTLSSPWTEPRLETFWHRLALLMLAVGSAYLFSVFYMQSRGLLREVVWGGGSIEQAVDNVVSSATNFDVSTAGDDETLYRFDMRMNQSVFVGLAIERLRHSPENFEAGATLAMALLAWVPRAVWPEKPERGGSAFISKHTGLKFSEGTSFGAGPVFEFYVNFGYFGVFVGFLGFGIVLRLLDVAAFRALGSADLPAVAKNLLAGIVLLQPLADLFFVVTGLATALLVGWGLRSFMRYRVPGVERRMFLNKEVQ